MLGINVAKECRTSQISTMDISRKKDQVGQIINVMNLETALGHKIGAWNERQLMRDLYDIYFIFQYLNVKPEMDVIKKRLEKVQRRKAQLNMSLDDLINELKNFVPEIIPEKLENQLKDYLPVDELPGLDIKIIRSINLLIDYLRSYNDKSKPPNVILKINCKPPIKNLNQRGFPLY